MRRVDFAVALLACALGAAGLSEARSKKKGGGSQSPPGVFDYYVLSLSWSPEHCASPAGHNDNVQCAPGRHFGFVVHGLWPQFERGFPDNCGTGPGLSQQQVDAMLDMMPSPKLIRHEWEKHGVCSGLASARYFETIRAARKAFSVPAEFQQPAEYITIEPAKLKQKLLASNPALRGDGMALECGGRYLDEVRVCLGKDLKPRPCGSDVRDRCAIEKVVLRPVR